MAAASNDRIGLGVDRSSQPPGQACRFLSARVSTQHALPGVGELPVQAIQALPYVLTVVLLAGFIGRSMAPAALGKPYLKER